MRLLLTYSVDEQGELNTIWSYPTLRSTPCSEFFFNEKISLPGAEPWTRIRGRRGSSSAIPPEFIYFTLVLHYDVYYRKSVLHLLKQT